MGMGSRYCTSGCRGSSPREPLWWSPSITVTGYRWITVGYVGLSEVYGAPGRPLVPTEGPKLTPISNDINSLTAVPRCCLGRFWWPVWWPAFFDDDCKAARVSASGSHDGLMRPPVGLRNRWLSKEGTKGGGCCCLWFLRCLWLL